MMTVTFSWIICITFGIVRPIFIFISESLLPSESTGIWCSHLISDGMFTFFISNETSTEITNWTDVSYLDVFLAVAAGMMTFISEIMGTFNDLFVAMVVLTCWMGTNLFVRGLDGRDSEDSTDLKITLQKVSSTLQTDTRLWTDVLSKFTCIRELIQEITNEFGAIIGAYVWHAILHFTVDLNHLVMTDGPLYSSVIQVFIESASMAVLILAADCNGQVFCQKS